MKQCKFYCSYSFLTLYFVFISIVFSIEARAGEFAISPMMIEFDAAPGSVESFEFSIHGKKNGKVRLFLSDLHQEATGHMAFKDLDVSASPMAGWVSLDKELVDVKKNEIKAVKGFLKVPRSAKGSHVVAIMVEEEKSGKSKGISLNVRYAIILTLDIKGRKARMKSEFTELTVEEQSGKKFVTAWFKNNSDRDANLSSLIQLRDSKRKLIARIPLKTKSAWSRGDENSRVFPGSKVKVYGPLGDDVEEGEYLLMSRNKFGGQNQPSLRETVQIKRGEKMEEKTIVEVESDKNIINVRVAPNSRGESFSAFRIKNPYPHSITVKLPLPRKGENLEYRFSPQTIELPSDSSKMVTLKQKFYKKPIPMVYKAEANNSSDIHSEFLIRTHI